MVKCLSDTTYMIPDVSDVHHEFSDEGATIIIEERPGRMTEKDK
jgi:hypothetical protein